MTVSESLLIVEDESEWRAIYERVARRQGFTTIEQTATLAGAEELLRSRTYGVAFVDVGLDVDDDENIDGLRVMEHIRSLGDETSIIVVTGRHGPDVVDIARDALRKFHAYELVSKQTVQPKAVQELLAGALVAFKNGEAQHRPAAHEVLRGPVEANVWDEQLLRALKVARGASGLYAFLDTLLGRYVPVVPPPGFLGLRVDPTTGIAQASFWSRAVGQAVLVVMGPRSTVDGLGPVEGVLLGQTVGAELSKASSGDAVGVVFALAQPRETF